ncbi:hypothetical protein [Parapedobacter tibetensis]|uniref:hypothetical protein n=1 Tax=Parapedobacter tibetensis TaxID=2972951 RepID=UPI00214D7AFD|nr:hypothetical protein [Parapedobacter tibetensis]
MEHKIGLVKNRNIGPKSRTRAVKPENNPTEFILMAVNKKTEAVNKKMEVLNKEAEAPNKRLGCMQRRIGMVDTRPMLMKTKIGFTFKKNQPAHRCLLPTYHWIIPVKNRADPLLIGYMTAQNNVVPARNKPVFALNNAGFMKDKGAWWQNNTGSVQDNTVSVQCYVAILSPLPLL